MCSMAGLSGFFSRVRSSAMGSPPVSCVSKVSSLAPRIMDRMLVHTSEVMATTGMRMYMGEKAKLAKVAGTHTFHSARTSSPRLLRYFSRASTSEPPQASSRTA